MRLLRETKEFEIPAGELLEFETTFKLIETLLRTMPGWYVVNYSFDDETMETKVEVAKSHDSYLDS